MADLTDLEDFDANLIGDSLLPAGDYRAVVVDSEKLQTKSGSGIYLKLTFQILSGPFKDRHLVDRIILSSSSEQAQRIGRAELAALCRAVGISKPRDSFELHNTPLIIKVVVRVDKDGARRNDIFQFKKCQPDF